MADSKPKITRNNFVSSTLKLLEKERETEIEETKLLTEKLPAKELQRRGVCLLKLHISSRQTGLFGRVVVVLETHQDSLPSHSFSPGDIVGLNHSQSDATSEILGSGVVTKVGPTSVTIAFDDSQDLYGLADGIHDYYKITKLANDVTYKRLKRALGHLDDLRHVGSSRLVDVLFGEAEPLPPAPIQDVPFVNTNLDVSQRDAVHFTLAQRDVAIVHGPPGTGKTTTVIEIILQAVRLGSKVLACAPSNIAVDNLVERLAGSKTKIVRLGHPARLLPHLQKYSLDAMLASSEDTRLVEDVRKDLDKAMKSIRSERDKGGKQKLREDMKYLRKELRQRADAATRDILKRADVVLVTLTSATSDGPLRLLGVDHFEVAVIDEVSQAMEAACWIPLLRTAGKCVLAGDHLQLPPTILSTEAAKEGLEVTLMERLLELYGGDQVMRMLTTQYRMNSRIMQWSSNQLYQSRLQAHTSVQDHLLRELPGVEDNDVTSIPLLYIDTAGCDLTELDLPEEISKGNEGEADIVAAHVGRLVNSGLTQDQVAVIAPYNLQVELIRLRLAEKYAKVEVKSVDGFQGREKEAVVISLVRSNAKGEVGFLSERRRINVAVTRARRHLTVVGDSETVGKDSFLKSLVEYLNAEGEVQTAQQYINDGVLGETSTSRPEHVDDLIDAAKQSSHNNNKGARPKVAAPRPSTANRKQDKQGRKQDKQDKHQTQQEKKSKQAAQEAEAAVNSQIEEIQTQLDQFMLDGRSDMLEFPPTLTSHDRFLVHELSEKMGLGHTSKGDGEERHIVVTKPSAKQPPVGDQTVSHNSKDTNKTKQSKKTDHIDRKLTGTPGEASKDISKRSDKMDIAVGGIDKHTEDEKDDDVKAQVNVDTQNRSDGKVQCHVCGKDVIKANIMLHEMHCAKRQNQPKDSSNQYQSKDNAGKANDAKKKNVSKSAKTRQLDKELAKKMEDLGEDDFDALLDTVKKMDSNCCFKKCKKSVQTLCNVCNFCGGRYCMSHYIPEVHGCGDAARSAARAQISKDGVLFRGSGVPNRKPDDAKKAHLQRKLDGKLTDLADKRKSKSKPKK